MSGAPTHLLFECATGCAVFQTLQVEEIGSKTAAVQESIKDLNAFSRMVKLVSFAPFKNALDALQSCLDISEGEWQSGERRAGGAALQRSPGMGLHVGAGRACERLAASSALLAAGTEPCADRVHRRRAQ